MGKTKWKLGDIVRLTEAKRFVRCGYPLYLPDVAEDIAENRIEKLYDAMRAFGIAPVNTRRVIDQLASAFAYAEIQAKRFGGKQRSIYETDFDEGKLRFDQPALERKFVIVNRFHVMTGEYYAPDGYRSYDGEYAYSAGGLDKQKYNTILVLESWWTGRIFDLKHATEMSNLPRKNLIQSYDCVWDIRAEKIGSVLSP